MARCERPASPAQGVAWRDDRLQHAQPCLPRGYGLGWLDSDLADPGAARSEAAGQAVLLPELTVCVCAWRTVGPGAGERAVVSCQCLAVHVHGEGPAAVAWLGSLAEGQATASDTGPTYTPLSRATRQTVSANEHPPGRRLALLLGLTALQEPEQELPDGSVAWPTLGAAALPAGTCGAALQAACAVLDTEQLRRDTTAELLLHLPTAQPDWRAAGTPDVLLAPAGARGTCAARLLADQPCAILYAQSGRSTPDSVTATAQLVAVGAALELAREARRRGLSLAGDQAGPGLRVPLLLVGLPADWDTVDLDDGRLLARAWRFAFNAGAGRVDVWRTERLTVGTATRRAAHHCTLPAGHT